MYLFFPMENSDNKYKLGLHGHEFFSGIACSFAAKIGKWLHQIL